MKPEILTAANRNPALADKCAMGIMIKTPRNGFSKTRLCPPFSLEEAAGISSCFLKDISSSIEALARQDPFAVGVAIYTPVGSEDQLGELLPRGFKIIAQQETDFGKRLVGATEDLFSAGFAAVCLINSDSPTLPLEYLQELATALKSGDDRMVIGPSSDGGYYALGLRRPHRRLFEDITWNADQVCSQTIERSEEVGLPVVKLPVWYDVDDQAMLNRLLSELSPERAIEAAPTGSSAPNTKDFLRRILEKEGAGRVWPSVHFASGSRSCA
jgi:rSAM/selenodomain-associated transferase 1